MKFFHLSDMHIGKQLHRYSLKEDQEAILWEITDYAWKIHPDAIVIAGDIYDKSTPSAEAVTIFDRFLTGLAEITPKIPILIISGNHDSAERLQYASEILKKNHIYMAGSVPETEGERIRKVILKDEEGEVDFYLLPFMKPSYVRNVFRDNPPESYSEAVKRIIERENIDYDTRRNVLVSHQFYVGDGGEAPKTCDSEVCSVGGIDQVDTAGVAGFDYVALGHLHGAQKVGSEKIRYCGTPLKYSVSECGHHKTLTVVTLKSKKDVLQIEELPLHPIRDVRKKTGTLEEILAGAREEEREDYVSITLTDEIDPYKPREQLERVYSHVLEIRVDNQRTRKKLEETEEEPEVKDPFSAFEDFYREMQGKDMSEEEKKVMEQIFDEVKGE
ncbi:MAG: exonuclease SbcCD subunit D [Dorea sp.]|uniref:exonuclease SbcCD subunit D n=1 Tax=Dorea sp. YH-dor226 TaxID=3151119 RepID=UPI003043385D|nr:exonuclease SbcCD subunit D [Dorea sp.]